MNRFDNKFLSAAVLLFSLVSSCALFSSCEVDDEEELTATVTVLLFDKSINKYKEGELVYCFKQRDWDEFTLNPDIDDWKLVDNNVVATKSNGSAIFKLEPGTYVFVYKTSDGLLQKSVSVDDNEIEQFKFEF